METKEEKIVKIPESITINGITYAVKDTPELQAFIQEVSKVEKQKLYTQFEAIKGQLKSLQEVQVVPDSNSAALLQQMKEMFVTKDDLKQSLSDTIKDAVKPLLDTNEKNNKNALEKYRESVIQMNLDTCIPDLVKGETKEEIDASLAESIRIRAAYPSPTGQPQRERVVDPLIVQQQQQPNANPTPVQTAPPQPTIPQVPNRPSPEVVSGAEGVKKMTMSEFAKNRDGLLQQLQSTYGN